MLTWKTAKDLKITNKLTLPDGTELGTNQFLAAGAARTLSKLDAGKTIKLDTAAGSIVTLPRATGSGLTYKFLVTVIATSNSHIVKVGNTTDGMIGGVVIADTDTGGAASSFFAATAGTDDTITLNRTTTGSVTRGETIEVTDVAVGVFAVSALLSGSGTVATPFSATV